MSQTTTVLTEVAAFIFGRRYYANIINTRGTGRCEISCYIFRTRDQAQRHRDRLAGNLSYMYVETISFRSRKEYATDSSCV